MWRFLDGVNKPEPKQKQTVAEKRKYFQVYEKEKRSRSFNTNWTKNNTWLKDSEKGMLCDVCILYGEDKTSSFITGCQSYKIDSIVKHAASKSHLKAALIHNAKERPVCESEAAKIKLKLNEKVLEKLNKMFRNVHALVSKNRPLSDFMWMCELDDVKGCDLGKTYRNTEYAKIFLDSIVSVEFEKVKEEILDAKFVCLIGDGSTGSSVQEQEMWFSRHAIKGEIMVKFIGIHSEEKGSAANIVSGLKTVVENNLDVSWSSLSNKLVALACDGASVMTGCVGGVGALLRKEQPSLLTIHCMAHRLELVLKDACKKGKLYDKTVNVLLMGLYYFYHNSPLNRAMLVRSFHAVTDCSDMKSDLLVPTRVGGTRWIGHTVRALLNLSKSYKYLTQHLGQLKEATERVSVDSKAKATAFLRLLVNKDILCMLYLLMDVLSPLNRLSKILQDRTSVIGTQHAELAAVLEVVNKYKTSDGPYLRKVVEVSEFAGLQLTHCNMPEFPKARTQLLGQIEEALLKRFSEFSCPSVILSTRIAHMAYWPKCWEQLKGFGDDALTTLINHFNNLLNQAGVDTAEAELEWTLLKKKMHDEKCLSDHMDWKSVNDRFGDSHKNILKIMDLILTMSPSSAEAERGFSQMKLIKTPIRSKLNQKSLNQCLAVRLLSDDISSFDPNPAINKWNGSGPRSRRPQYKDTSSVKSAQVTPVTSVDNESELEEDAITAETLDESQSPAYLFKDTGSDSEFSDIDDGEDEASVFAKLLDDYRSG